MKNNFIIESPKLQPLRLKYSSTLLTFIFWVLWFYLWVPLITLGAWWLQISFFENEILVESGLDAFLDILPVFIAITLVLNSTLALWAYYNFSRFKGMDRRKALPPVNNADLIQIWGISKEALDTAQANKVSTILLSDNGEITISDARTERIKGLTQTDAG